MKVTAIKVAFYNGRRVRVGDVVEVPEGLKGSWFAKSDSPAAKAAKVAPKKDEPKALSELAKPGAKTFMEVHDKSALA